MRLLISLSALLLSTLFVQMGIGSLRPFDAISGQALGSPLLKSAWLPDISPAFSLAAYLAPIS